MALSMRSTEITAIIILTVLILTLLLINVLSPVVNALIVAGLLAFFVDPLVGWLASRKGISRKWAARLVFILFMLIFFITPYFISGVVINWFQQLLSWLGEAWASIETMLIKPFKLFGYLVNPKMLYENLEQVSGYVLQVIFESSSKLISGISTNLLGLLSFLLGLYFFLKVGNQITTWLVQATPLVYRRDIKKLLDELNDIWVVFVRVQILIFFILLIIICLGALFVIWLFTSGILKFSVLLFIFLMFLVYALAQQVDNLWLHPQLMGNKLELNPGLVFAGLAAALIISGVLGAFLIVPLMASVKLFGRYIYRQLLDLDPWTDNLSEE